MNPLLLSMAVAALVWGGLFGIYVFLLRRRALARFRHGYLYSLMIALVGVALMSSTIIGIWGYQAARQLLEDAVVQELHDVGDIVENELVGSLRHATVQLTGVGRTLAPLLEARTPTQELSARLRAAQELSDHFLELHVFDADGRLLASSDPDVATVSVSRQAIGATLDGAVFVSDAVRSSVFHRQVLFISVPIRSTGGDVVGAIGTRYDLQTRLADLIGTSRFNQSGYAVIADGDGHVVAHPDSTRLEQDISGYPAVAQARATGGSGSVVAPNAGGVDRLFVFRPLANPSTLPAPPWVLLTEIDAAEMMAPVRHLRDELFLGVLLLLLVSLVIAHQLSRSVHRPLHQLGEFAQQIGAGDLTGQVAVSGRDVAGQLGEALNAMAAGLRERDQVKEVFGRYIATQVTDQILSGQINLGGEARVVTILFSDIRNFTGMSEQMTPQQVVAFLNDYFSEMVDAVFDHGGVLDKFMGDGLLAVFGSLGNDPDHPRSAVRAALRMKALLGKINGMRSIEGLPPIQIGVGIHTAEVIVGNIGSRRRLEYTVVGDGVNTSSRLQGLNKEYGTTILISQTTYEAIGDEFECRRMPEAQLRGKVNELAFYEVISSRAMAPVA
jgi:adenylate cyclase